MASILLKFKKLLKGLFTKNTPVTDRVSEAPTTVSTSSSAESTNPLSSASTASFPTVDKYQELFDKISDLTNVTEEKFTKQEENVKEALDKAKNAHQIAIFGFIALLIVVAGLVFAYASLVITTQAGTPQNKQDDAAIIMQLESSNTVKLIEKSTKTEEDLLNLKNCLKNGGWKSCF